MKLNEEWEVKSDQYNWILVHHVMGKDKHGNPKPKEEHTYHASLRQCLEYAVDQDAKNCDTCSQILDKINQFQQITNQLVEAGNERTKANDLGNN